MEKMVEGLVVVKAAPINYIEEMGIPYKKKTINYKVKYDDGKLKDIQYEGCLITKEQALHLDVCGYVHHTDLKLKKIEERIILYSDGGSFNNGNKNPDLPTFGSYASFITMDGELIHEEPIVGGEEEWTNNIGELTGAIKALDTLFEYFDIEKGTEITLITDSQYVTKGISEYMHGWKKNKWKNNQKKVVANLELWKYLDSHYLGRDDEFNLRVQWTRGHTDGSDIHSKFNQMCDDGCGEVINEWLESKGLPTR